MHMSVNGPIWVCVTEEVRSSSGSIVYLLVADLTDQISRRSESISMLLLLLLLLRLGERENPFEVLSPLFSSVDNQCLKRAHTYKTSA